MQRPLWGRSFFFCGIEPTNSRCSSLLVQTLTFEEERGRPAAAGGAHGAAVAHILGGGRRVVQGQRAADGIELLRGHLGAGLLVRGQAGGRPGGPGELGLRVDALGPAADLAAQLLDVDFIHWSCTEWWWGSGGVGTD